MLLRENLSGLKERLYSFWDAKHRLGALIIIRSIAELEPAAMPLDQQNLPENWIEYFKKKVCLLQDYWEHRRGLDDDRLPAVQPWYGLAEHSAFINSGVEADVQFSDITSWHHPFLHDWTELKKMKLDQESLWYRMVISGMEYLGEFGEGLMVKMRGLYSPLDLANAVRGNDLFLDFYLSPDKVKSLLAFCTEALQQYLPHQLKIATCWEGGQVNGYDIWMPEGSVGHISEDTATLCSPDTYREFGLPYTRKLITDYPQVMLPGL